MAGLLTFRPLPRALSRPLSLLVLVGWALQMGVLLHHTWTAAPVALAADLSRYGSTAKWKGIYYRGEKIGFSVSQTLPKGDGYEIQEDGQLQLTLMGMGTPAGTISYSAVTEWPAPISPASFLSSLKSSRRSSRFS